MSQGYQRTLPALDATNRFYWTSGQDGVLRMLRCQSCGFWLHPPRPICPECLSKALAPEVLTGRGEIFSFTLNAKSWGPGRSEERRVGKEWVRTCRSRGSTYH